MATSAYTPLPRTQKNFVNVHLDTTYIAKADLLEQKDANITVHTSSPLGNFTSVIHSFTLGHIFESDLSLPIIPQQHINESIQLSTLANMNPKAASKLGQTKRFVCAEAIIKPETTSVKLIVQPYLQQVPSAFHSMPMNRVIFHPRVTTIERISNILRFKSSKDVHTCVYRSSQDPLTGISSLVASPWESLPPPSRLPLLPRLTSSLKLF